MNTSHKTTKSDEAWGKPAEVLVSSVTSEIALESELCLLTTCLNADWMSMFVDGRDACQLVTALVGHRRARCLTDNQLPEHTATGETIILIFTLPLNSHNQNWTFWWVVGGGRGWDGDRVCVCVCMCVHAFMRACVCVCVCACVRDVSPWAASVLTTN